MHALLLIPLGYRATDSNGAAVAGARLFTWAAGTTDDLETYHDHTFATPHDNPIEADGGGLLPAVYGLHGRAYKLRLETPAGALIWERDHVTTALVPTVVTTNVNYDVTAADGPDVLVLANAATAPLTVALPSAIGRAGWRVTVKKTNGAAHGVHVNPAGSETINGLSVYILSFQNDLVSLVSDGSNWHIDASHTVTLFGSVVPGGLQITGGAVVSDSQPRCVAYATVTQSIPDNVATAVALNAEDIDIGGLHDLVVNNSRVTVLTAGLYLVRARVAFAGQATGARAVQIRKSGTAIAEVRRSAVGATAEVIECLALHHAFANEYFEIYAYQNSGGALNIGSAAAREQQSELSAVMLW